MINTKTYLIKNDIECDRYYGFGWESKNPIWTLIELKKDRLPKDFVYPKKPTLCLSLKHL